jgi:deoxyribonuclease-4
MGAVYQRIGLHVSAAGGVEKAPERAHELGAEVFQFFSRSPRGGPAAPISKEQALAFRAQCTTWGLESYIHTPYYINFASKNKRVYHGSIATVREELARGTQLGVKYVMTHMGSAKDHTTEPGETRVPNSALQQAIEGLRKVFEDRSASGAASRMFSTKLLLEISAGAGAVLGDSFEELSHLLRGLKRRDVYICLDTCHLFASGYDLRTSAAIDATMRHFKRTLGLSRLKLVHANDSKGGLGEHKDRHEHIGQGKIGSGGFQALLGHRDFQKTNFVLETKHDQLSPRLAVAQTVAED